MGLLRRRIWNQNLGLRWGRICNGSLVRLCRLISPLKHVSAVWSWISHLATLCFSFLICKTERLTTSESPQKHLMYKYRYRQRTTMSGAYTLAIITVIFTKRQKLLCIARALINQKILFKCLDGMPPVLKYKQRKFRVQPSPLCYL